MIGYHTVTIKKGVVGQISKIVEEVDELVDADSQHNKLLILNELSDIVGSIDMYLERHHPTVTIF